MNSLSFFDALLDCSSINWVLFGSSAAKKEGGKKQKMVNSLESKRAKV